MNNRFINFCNNYTDYVNNIIKDRTEAYTKCEYFICAPEHYLGPHFTFIDKHFYFKKVINKDITNDLLIEYKRIKAVLINNDICLSSWFNIIEEFVDFLDYAENILLYIKSNNEVISYLKYRPNKYNRFKITVKLMEILKLNYKVSIIYKKPLDNKLGININIYHVNSNKTYTISINDYCTITYDDFSTEQKNIFRYIKNQISQSILNQFKNIINNIIYHYHDIYGTNWKEVLEDGLWIRK